MHCKCGHRITKIVIGSFMHPSKGRFSFLTHEMVSFRDDLVSLWWVVISAITLFLCMHQPKILPYHFTNSIPTYLTVLVKKLIQVEYAPTELVEVKPLVVRLVAPCSESVSFTSQLNASYSRDVRVHTIDW